MRIFSHMKQKLFDDQALSKSVLVRLRRGELDRLKELAAEETRTLSAQVRHILRQALTASHGPGQPHKRSDKAWEGQEETT